MAYQSDGFTSPETMFCSFTGLYIGDEVEINFLELDSLLGEAAQTLKEAPIHAGAGRDFELTLDNFDEDSDYKNAEILGSFIVRLWEDDESEINLIIKSITEELENVGVMIESFNLLGIGKR